MRDGEVSQGRVKRGNMMQGNKPDRYVSFVGIEGEINSRKLLKMLRLHIDDPCKSSPFWEFFTKKLEHADQLKQSEGTGPDELFLIHSYINNIRDLLEQYDDLPALALLEQIEIESC